MSERSELILLADLLFHLKDQEGDKIMERLMEWICDDKWYRPKAGVSNNKIHITLGKYEGTGLTPEEVISLQTKYETLNKFEDSQLEKLLQTKDELEADRDYWKNEAIKATAKLGEIKIAAHNAFDGSSTI